MYVHEPLACQEIELQMVLSHHIGTGNWLGPLEGQAVLLPSEHLFSTPSPFLRQVFQDVVPFGLELLGFCLPLFLSAGIKVRISILTYFLFSSYLIFQCIFMGML